MSMTHAESHGSRAASSIISANEAASQCIAYVEELLRAELQEEALPDVAKLSIALGAIELPLTNKKEADQQWPAGRQALEAQVAACLEAFDGFVGEMHSCLQAAGPSDARAKVKLVADAVWSKLTGSFSKDVLHAQHLFNFASMLLPGVGKARASRQLDCAGVVTTTYAACQRLAQAHGHADLAVCRMQISEDHCWLCLAPSSPGRLSSVEVTTDTAAKRGLSPSEEAWAGWLYTGGHAVLCRPRTALVALVNSLNPALTGGKGGRDSEQLQAAQHRLLALLWREAPGVVYPAALCSLADLEEVALQDKLDDALAAGQQQQLDSLLRRAEGDSQELFERAIELAAGRDCAEGERASNCELANGSVGDGGGDAAAEAGSALAAEPAGASGAGGGADGSSAGGPAGGNTAAAAAVAAAGDSLPPSAQPSDGDAEAGSTSSTADLVAAAAPQQPAATGSICPEGQKQAADPGWQFYPYSYLGGFLARRAEFLVKCAAAFPGSTDCYSDMALASLQGALAAWAQGAGVLAKYKHSPADDQLYKDVEGALEYCHDGLTSIAKRTAARAGGGGGGSNGAGLSDPTLLEPVLRLWDGICAMFAGKPKPGAWVGLLLKIAKLFEPGVREAAAAAYEPRSEPLIKARKMWGTLKPATLRPLLEATDVAEGESRAIKRTRR